MGWSWKDSGMNVSRLLRCWRCIEVLKQFHSKDSEREC